jgi:hypothetical protein
MTTKPKPELMSPSDFCAALVGYSDALALGSAKQESDAVQAVLDAYAAALAEVERLKQVIDAREQDDMEAALL